MEEYGYLNELEKNNLINELENKGLERSRMIVLGNNIKQDYGEPIALKIEYEYASKLYRITNKFGFDKHEVVFPIIIEKKSFSKI